MEINNTRVICANNEALAAYMLEKRQELANNPKGLKENTDITLLRAYSNVCNSKNHIKNLKDLSQVKGVGKWILKLMQGFFEACPGSSESEDLTENGEKVKGAKRYLPQKNSVAYALLISLYRGTANGNEFMRKQELIDAAEASGLSRVPIMPEKAKGRSAAFGSSQRDWYTGWNCMKTLITKGLVVKSSCPAKYMLTKEGREAARECLIRSGLVDPLDDQADVEGLANLDAQKDSEMEYDCPHVGEKATGGLNRKENSIDIPNDSLERFTNMGFSRDEVIQAFTEVSKTHQNKEISALWPTVLCHLRESQIYGVNIESQIVRGERLLTSINRRQRDNGLLEKCSDRLAPKRSDPRNIECDVVQPPELHYSDSVPNSSSLRACSSGNAVYKSSNACPQVSMNIWSIPPLSYGEKFEDVYEVILILDDREQFATQGSRSRRIIENICTQFKIKIEVRRLPVGDGIWIARHKYVHSEYVLDFIVERKKVDDLRSSIRDNRYKDQKLRLLRCGLKKLIYIVEGDPNYLESAESIKTACFTTEILEGFDVHRTNGLGDTLRKYGYLTQEISQYYRLQFPEDQSKCSGVCPPYDEFVKRCQDIEKMTVSDVFAIQLMQVPQVTEEVAIAVLDMYPTLLSLARAYSLLDHDISAQEDMLRKQSNNVISATASKNIFRLVWGN